MKRRNIQRPFLGLYGHDEPHTNKHRDSDPVNTAVRSCLSLCGQGTWCAACHSRARRCAPLGGFAVPGGSFGIILCDAPAVGVHPPEGVLCVGVVLLGGLAVPATASV